MAVDLKNVPNTPGVYKFFNKHEIIYIGKAKDLKKRVKVIYKLKKFGFYMPTIFSPLSYISKGVKVGDGCQIFHGVIINKNTEIGDNCVINNQTLVEHDVKIQKNSHISTRVTINGGCLIGQSVFIGSGSVLRENLRIKNDCFIKMGSIIKK